MGCKKSILCSICERNGQTLHQILQVDKRNRKYFNNRNVSSKYILDNYTLVVKYQDFVPIVRWQYLVIIVNLCLLKSTNQYMGQEGIYSLLIYITYPTLIYKTILWCFEICVRRGALRKPTDVLGGRLQHKPLNVYSHSLTTDFNDTMCTTGYVPLITRLTIVTEKLATWFITYSSPEVLVMMDL